MSPRITHCVVPQIVVNCKAYEAGIGINAVTLAKAAFRVSKQHGVRIALAVQPQDISAVSQTGIAVLAQHVDAVGFGAFTGHVLPAGVKSAGADGTLINHSEKRLSYRLLADSIVAARSAGLFVLVCAQTPSAAVKIARLKPDAIAVEPPELIGGNVAVSQAKPEVITKTTAAVKNIPILCGAGVKTGEDVARAFELGAKGILVASGVVNAKNPARVIEDFARNVTSKVR